MSGDVLYSSILYWNASNILADLYESAGPVYSAKAAAMRAQARHAASQISAELWSDTLGAFVAATELGTSRNL